MNEDDGSSSFYMSNTGLMNTFIRFRDSYLKSNQNPKYWKMLRDSSDELTEDCLETVNEIVSVYESL
jgi:hypothetical protein